jgi:hypothetical protein
MTKATRGDAQGDGGGHTVLSCRQDSRVFLRQDSLVAQAHAPLPATRLSQQPANARGTKARPLLGCTGGLCLCTLPAPLLMHSSLLSSACALFSSLLSSFTLPGRNTWAAVTLTRLHSCRKLTRLPNVCAADQTSQVCAQWAQWAEG